MLRQLVLFSLLLIANVAHSHPHAWVSLTSDFVINEQTELYEVRQRWIFDPFYSLVILDDLRKQYTDDELALRMQADQIVNNLQALGYYSHLSLNSQPIDLGRPYKWHMSTATVGDDEIMILEMLFSVSPISLINHQVEWTVFDPTYYVSMRHDAIDYIRIINASSAECEPQLIEPTPTDEQIMLASSLDKTQTSTEGLGEIFAQRSTIQCF
ncbi:DUF1007 family protein [Reinekea thalattae]|uniref:DUF1007 family protein n=1 Tax=Reinekea thalattae TaxID=2593301 RepID=A0A5C8Z5U3_9GAMM|nr:DUF1007 family protein [Reinekea thalattae]TXR53485.1 DUF1007 family protein [Reinekea thalattae]